MSKVSLSVHKSNLEKRERRMIHEDLKAAVENVRQHDVVAYAVVGFSRDGAAYASFDTGRIIPEWAFASACEKVIDHYVEMVEADFKAPLKRIF
jgi:hypothetical protein